MRPGRLLLTLYLGAIVVVFVAAGLFLSFQVRGLPGEDIRALARTTLTDLAHLRDDPAQLRATLAELTDARIEVSLYRPDRTLIGTSITPPLAIEDDDDGDRRTITHQLRDHAGRVIAIGCARLHPPSGRRAVAPLLVMFGMLVLLVIAIAHQVGVPLQRIGDAARRFGRGDLTARAQLTRNDELGEVGRAFDEMADRVTTLMTAQRELMANVSHELQTPLARIQVAVDLMVDGVDERAKDLVPEISHDLGEVERLIDDVMTLSRFDLAHTQGRALGTPLRTEPVALAELFDKAVARFRVRHPGRALDVAIAPALPVAALDAMLVRRAIENLLDNARKYSEPDTAIQLAATATATTVTVAITDHGIGIDAADLQQLFTPFFRTDRSRTRATGGIGLGLVLARRIVEAHGGTIAVRSEVRSGTTVTVALPVVTPCASGISPNNAPAVAGHHPTGQARDDRRLSPTSTFSNAQPPAVLDEAPRPALPEAHPGD